MMALTTDLLAYYRLDGDTSDETGTYDGTNNGATSTSSGKVGKAYDFDGSNDYINCGSVNITTSHTISFWVNSDSDSTNQNPFTHDDGTTQLDFVWYSSSNIRYALTGASSITATTSMSRGTWYHVVGTYDGTTMKLYINGSLDGSATASGWTGGSRTVYIGALTNPAYYFNGKIDEVGIWSRALSADEVSELYNNGDGLTYDGDIGEFFDSDDLRFGLAAYYRFNGDATDELGNHDGSVSGAVPSSMGRMCGGYYFDGSNDKINVGDFNDVGSISICTWFKTTATGKNMDLIDKYDNSPRTSPLSLRISSAGDTVVAIAYDGSTSSAAQSSSSYNDGKWHFACAVRDAGNSVKLYVDGSLIVTTTDSLANDLSNDISWAIGARARTDQSDFYLGYLDEVGMWSRALSDSNISELYNSGYGVTFDSSVGDFVGYDDLRRGLVSYYPFNYDANDEFCSNDCTVSGASLTYDGKSGFAYSFDGSNDYINPGITSFGQITTISYWYKSSQSSQYSIYSCDGDNRLEVLHNNTSGGRIRIYTKVSGTAIVKKHVDIGSDLYDGNWHHVVVIIDMSSTTGSKLYFDGSEKTLTDDGTQSTATSLTTDYAPYFGAYNGSSVSNYMSGTLDEVGLWDRALTSTEVTELYNSGTGKTYDSIIDDFIDGDSLRVMQSSYYNFDSDATDSYSSNDGTVNGATSTTSGLIESAYDYDGSNDTISYPSQDSTRSVSVWFNGLSEFRGIVCQYVDNNNTWKIVYDTDGYVRLYYSVGGSGSNIATSSTYSDNTWIHAVVTYDGSDTKFYVDGSLVGTATGVNVFNLGSSRTFVTGCYYYNNSGANYFNGVVDELGVWNRGLTSTEVTTLYNSGDGLQYPYGEEEEETTLSDGLIFGMNF